MTETTSIAEYLQEFITEAEKVADSGRQAAKLLADGDMQWACNTIALSHYSLGYLSKEYEGLLAEFEKQGVTPKS